MPAYATSGTNNLTLNTQLPTVLQPGDEKYLFGTVGANPIPGISQNPNDSNVVKEAAATGVRSIAVQLGPRPGGGSPPSAMIQVVADGAVGAIEVDVQDAAVDADGAYSTPNDPGYKMTVFTAIAGGLFISTTEVPLESGRFVTLKVINNPNAVNLTAKIIYA